MAAETPAPPPILVELPEQMVGEKVLLRPYRRGDGDAVWEAIEESREHLRPWLPWVDSHKTPADSEAFARRASANWLLRDDMTISIWERATGRYVGGSGLHHADWDVPSFEIGYWLRPSAEGKGYMSETVKLLCALAFETLHANRVFIRCDSINLRSAAVARRLGFVHEATFRRDSRSPSGELRDTFHFALTPDDYASVRAQW